MCFGDPKSPETHFSLTCETSPEILTRCCKKLRASYAFWNILEKGNSSKIKCAIRAAWKAGPKQES